MSTSLHFFYPIESIFDANRNFHGPSQYRSTVSANKVMAQQVSVQQSSSGYFSVWKMSNSQWEKSFHPSEENFTYETDVYLINATISACIMNVKMVWSWHTDAWHNTDSTGFKRDLVCRSCWRKWLFDSGVCGNVIQHHHKFWRGGELRKWKKQENRTEEKEKFIRKQHTWEKIEIEMLDRVWRKVSSKSSKSSFNFWLVSSSEFLPSVEIRIDSPREFTWSRGPQFRSMTPIAFHTDTSFRRTLHRCRRNDVDIRLRNKFSRDNQRVCVSHVAG